jgi:8-oxo-dGTP diphosphatase
VAGADVITVRVDAPRRVVSAGLPLWAPGDEFPLLGRRFRVLTCDVSGWRAVALSGPSLRIEVSLTGETLVTCTASRVDRRIAQALRRLAEGIAERSLALVGAPVVVGTLLVRGRFLLAQQRSYPPEAAGLWELPGGRVEPGESDVDAVVRECQEELGVEVEVADPVGPDVALPKGKLLRIYRATLKDATAEPRPHDHAALRWLTAGQLGTVPWLPADRVLLPALRQSLRMP